MAAAGMQVVYDFTWHSCAAQHKSHSQTYSHPAARTSTSAIPDSESISAQQSALEPLTSSQAASEADIPTQLPASEAITPAQTAYPIAALPHNAHRAVAALTEGQVIAVPTDTLYGLAADANSSKGIQSIYSIKHRQAQAPLAICIAEISDLHRYCHAEHLPDQMLHQLLPGPVTLILQRRQEAPLCAELNPRLKSIGKFSKQLTWSCDMTAFAHSLKLCARCGLKLYLAH